MDKLENKGIIQTAKFENSVDMRDCHTEASFSKEGTHC